MKRSAYGSKVGSGVFEGTGVLVAVGSDSMIAAAGTVIVLWICIYAVEGAVGSGGNVDKSADGSEVVNSLTVESGTGAAYFS